MPRTSHPLIFVLFVVLGAILIYPFITALLLAAITAYVFRPLVKKLQTHTRSYHAALGILILLIAGPLVVLSAMIVKNAAEIIGSIPLFGGRVSFLISAISEKIAGTELGAYISSYFLDINELVRIFTQYAVSLTTTFLHDVAFIFLDLAIYLIATYYFLRDGPVIIDAIKNYAATIPHEEERLVLSIITGLKRSFDVLFVSYITMSIITMFLAFLGYLIIGLPHAGMLAVISGIFGFLPVFGVWMVYVPAAAYEYFLGNVTSAIFIISYGVFVLTFATDFIIRPILGSEEGKVSSLTILLGFFSGPIIFGAKGILLGPVLLVTVETVLRKYMEYRIGIKKGAAPRIPAWK